MPTVEINAANWSYEERGAGKALVLVHGFPLDRRMWDAQMAGLADVCRVIAVDLPGFGQSQPPRPFTMKSLADDLHAFLDKVNARPAVLVGLSMGGYLALKYVTRYPTDLAGLALIDTRAQADDTEGKKNRMAMVEIAKAQGSSAIADRMEPKMLSSATMHRNPEVVKRLREIMESCPAQTMEYALIAMRDREDSQAELASIAVPTLIVVGDSDAITPPALSSAMNREIPHSRFCVIKNAGHMSPMERPEEVTNTLREFVRDCVK